MKRPFSAFEWEVLLRLTAEATDQLDDETHRRCIEAIEEGAAVTYSRPGDGYVQVFIADIPIVRVHEVSLSPPPEHVWMN